MTMTTPDDITEGCQTCEKSVIEPCARARNSTPLTTAFAYAIFMFMSEDTEFRLQQQ